MKERQSEEGNAAPAVKRQGEVLFGVDYVLEGAPKRLRRAGLFTSEKMDFGVRFEAENLNFQEIFDAVKRSPKWYFVYFSLCSALPH